MSRSFMGISRPSEALEAMCDGLEEADGRDDFRIDMTTFGKFGYEGEDYRKVCCGCAATCALQKLGGRDFPPTGIGNPLDRSLTLRERVQDVREFEGAMEVARNGGLVPLFLFFGLEDAKSLEAAKSRGGKWRLSTYDWKEQLAAVREAVGELREEGY